MSNHKKFLNGFAGKGYYIALILCAAAIGITGYLYQREPAEDIAAAVPEQPTLAASVATMATEADVPVIATQPQETEAPAAVTQVPVKKAMVVLSPLTGDQLAGYAMEALSYNQTTRDWRVHNGVDIAAEEGEPVMAAADGTVFAAGKDETMGYTVAIRHDGGYTTHYACLQEALCVQNGDTVSAGQTIGYVGSTALVETALGSHLHFAVTCQGSPMDPAEFLSLSN